MISERSLRKRQAYLRNKKEMSNFLKEIDLNKKVYQTNESYPVPPPTHTHIRWILSYPVKRSKLKVESRGLEARKEKEK